MLRRYETRRFYNGVAQEEVVYMYHTGPGYLLCVMRVVGVVWVCYSTYVTLLKFETKRRFFKRFAFIFSMWLLGLPLIVLVALATPTWVRPPPPR
jgi:TRAP-type C4-dicarboxylate transport system permease large subunit